jgi:hypothetical protein
MNNVPFGVNHDVSVMPVLDLEDVARDRVGCHGLDEIEPGLLEGDRVDPAVLVDKVAKQVVDLGSAHLVSGCRIGHNIDDSTLYDQRCDPSPFS